MLTCRGDLQRIALHAGQLFEVDPDLLLALALAGARPWLDAVDLATAMYTSAANIVRLQQLLGPAEPSVFKALLSGDDPAKWDDETERRLAALRETYHAIKTGEAGVARLGFNPADIAPTIQNDRERN